MVDDSATSGGATAAESPITKLAELRVKLAALQADYSDNYPDIVDTKAEISQLEKSPGASDADRLAARIGEGIGGDGTASARRRVLEEKIAACQRRIDQTPQHTQELGSVTSDYDAMLKEYHDLLSMQLAAEMQQEVVRRRQGQRVGLIEAPSVSRSSATPNRAAITIAGALMSLIGALVIPFGVSFTDTSFNNGDELREEIGFPVIIAIPYNQSSARIWGRGLVRVVLASSAGITVGMVAVMAYKQLHF
jgi:polysaccharide biosynthesis transport protein